MSFTRRSVLLASTVLALACGVTNAGELDRARMAQAPRVEGLDLAAPVTLGDIPVQAEKPGSLLDDPDAVPMGDIRQIADFHPETDRWTERHNRIRITLMIAAMFCSGELDIKEAGGFGLRLAWEVPGFIGIRIDSMFQPYAKLEMKAPQGFGGANPRSSRWCDGIFHYHTLSLGIFNPELSVAGLAFWAGFGGGLYIYNFQENDLFGIDSGIDGEFSDINIGGNIFVELDYKIADIFHVGIMIREHFVLADHTDEGRFYDLNDAQQSVDSGRNAGPLDDLAIISEFSLNISVLF